MSDNHFNRGKKVVLFGRTGDGKSIVANALVTGGIDKVEFESSDSAKGCTSKISKKSGRGWTVTDTVGLGDAEYGTITNDEARVMLTDFLKKVKDEYSHIIFVQKARRITPMEQIIWELFTKIFEGAEQAFVVLLTAVPELWWEENRSLFPKFWEGYEILCVDIPPVNKRRVLELKREVTRERSIEKLEADLITIFNKRGNRYARPNIAVMNDEELEKKASSMMGPGGNMAPRRLFRLAFCFK